MVQARREGSRVSPDNDHEVVPSSSAIGSGRYPTAIQRRSSNVSALSTSTRKLQLVVDILPTWFAGSGGIQVRTPCALEPSAVGLLENWLLR